MSKKKIEDSHQKWLEHGIDIPNNTVFLSGDVDADLAKMCITAFHAFDKSKPALVLLNSEGGCEFAGMAIYDTLRAHPAEVTVRVIGEACSMAAVILQAGDIRQMGKNSILMTHLGSIDESGHKENVRRKMKFSERFDVRLDQIMVDRINEKRSQTKEKSMDIKSWKKHDLFDNYMTSQEALDLGLIDEIYDPLKSE